jgi:putative aminopeptidase FrvX
MELLNQLCQVHAPAGEEAALADFILNYIKKNQANWKVKPQIIQGDQLQDSLLLIFGKPRTAVFAHMDSIGFTVRYHDQLVAIGGPKAETGYQLVGQDSLGPIACKLIANDGDLHYKFGRGIERGTSLTFKPNWRETNEYVQCCYMDNRLGIYNALKLCETLENGAIAFSCWEEHGGGSVPILAKILYEEYGVQQALISDITWVTEGVEAGGGVAISLRDRNLPRKSYIDRIRKLALESGIDHQLEVEGAGSSDGRELQISPYPFDWCFIGAPEQHVHSPNEKVHKHDIDCMLELYRYLMDRL